MTMERNILRELLVAIVVALGISVAWSLLASWVLSALLDPNSGTPIEQVYLRHDGEPVILHYEQGYRDPSPAVLSIDHEPIADQTTRNLIGANYLGNEDSMLPSGSDWQSRLSAVNDGAQLPAYWYLVHDGRTSGRAYGIGYDSRTHEVVGYFGQNGFTTSPPSSEEWFEISGRTGLSGKSSVLFLGEPYYFVSSTMYLIASDRLWSIDTAKRTVQAIADVPPNATMGFTTRLQDTAGRSNKLTLTYAVGSGDPATTLLFLRMPRRAMFVDPLTQQVTSYPLPPDLSDDYLAGFQLPHGELLLLANGAPNPVNEAIWITPTGEISSRKSIRLSLPRGAAPKHLALAMATAMPSPLEIGALLALQPMAAGSGEYTTRFKALLLESWPAIAVVLTLGAISAWATFRRQRRFAQTYAVFWAAFACLFGPAGWLAYRFHRDWPALVACPHCRQTCPRDRPTCADCGGRFTMPEQVGIEVFA